MKKAIFLIPLLALVVSCQSSNPSPPQVEGLFLSSNSVVEGTIVTTSITFWVSANKVDGEYVTDGQSLVVNVPVGISIVPGTSAIGFQGPRDPDSIVNCPDGTQSLVYNLHDAEIEDPYDFSDFTTVINFNVVANLPANQQKAQGAASLTPFEDPCSVAYMADVEYFVSQS